ncbi:MAG: hypothetical protein V2A66_09945 [Pseudomonadota bacterium]
MSARRATDNDKGRYGQAGYPAVEKLIDTEDFGEINAAFEIAYADLMDISKSKKGLKTQREARKAMHSLELTLDLLRELLAIKYRLNEEASKRATHRQ